MAITRRKTVTLGALAGIALGGLILPVQAQAATSSVTVAICNNGGRTLEAVKVTGVRADGSSTSSWIGASSNNCTLPSARWRTGQTLKFELSWKGYTSTTSESCSLASSLADGSARTCNYYY